MNEEQFYKTASVILLKTGWKSQDKMVWTKLIQYRKNKKQELVTINLNNITEIQESIPIQIALYLSSIQILAGRNIVSVETPAVELSTKLTMIMAHVQYILENDVRNAILMMAEGEYVVIPMIEEQVKVMEFCLENVAKF